MSLSEIYQVQDVFISLARSNHLQKVWDPQKKKAPKSRTKKGKSSLDRGVLVLALGAFYARMAVTLADSVKVGNPGLPVAIIHDKPAYDFLVAEKCLDAFDVLVPCDPKFYTLNGKFNPYWAKVHLDLLSPFKNTIIVDSDSLIFQSTDLEKEFRRYRDFDYAPSVSGCYDPHLQKEASLEFSITMGEASRRHRFSHPVYHVHSYYQFFKANERVKKFFSRARDVYRKWTDRPLRGCTPGGPFFDEPTLSLATGLSHLRIFRPLHFPMWERMLGGEPSENTLKRQFVGMTFVGNEVPQPWVDLYNKIALKNARTLGRTSCYTWESKTKSHSTSQNLMNRVLER
jgi:hypothetical protein